MRVLPDPIDFTWDKDNLEKNKTKHRIAMEEMEEVFLDEKHVIYKDVFHSINERRNIIIGKTKNGKLLYTVFTVRKTKIRVISSRVLNKKEMHLYEKRT